MGLEDECKVLLNVGKYLSADGWGDRRGMALGVIPDVNDELMGADKLMGAAHQHGTSIHM